MHGEGFSFFRILKSKKSLQDKKKEKRSKTLITE